MHAPREDTKPWYRQFWPWFIISIPGLTIVAALITIRLAVMDADPLVSDDYYKEGLAVNLVKAQERMAATLGIRLTLDYEESTQRLVAQMNDAPVGRLDHLEIELTHPTLSAEDRSLNLKSLGNGRYEGTLAGVRPSNWHVSVTPPEKTWKLRARWMLPAQPRLVLTADDG
ncbi:MAG: FixH family protein [Pseudomonadota bacterium]